MNFFKKVTLTYLITISAETPVLFFTYRWVVKGENIAATFGGVSFAIGIWVFYNVLEKMDLEGSE